MEAALAITLFQLLLVILVLIAIGMILLRKTDAQKGYKEEGAFDVLRKKKEAP
jgi:hypothetical protein